MVRVYLADRETRKMRAAVYARLSLAGDADEETPIHDQIKDGDALAKRRGATSIETYVDDGISAYKAAKRPAFERLLGDVKAGQVDMVIGWRADRLARRPRDAERLLDAIGQDERQPRAVVLGVVDGTDTSVPNGDTFLRFMVIMGNMESRAIAARVGRSHETRAAAGRFTGGPRAFGHNANRTEIIPAEAEAIRSAARLLLNGQSVKSILRTWKAQGIRTPRGNEWQHAALVNLLQQPRLVGLRMLRGVEGSGSIPPILDRETWEQACALLRDPERRPSLPGGQPRHLLSGLLTCGTCGVTMRAKGHGGAHNGPGYWTYSCLPDRPGACGRVAVRGDKTDEYVEGLIIEALRSPDLASLIAGEDDGSHGAEVRHAYIAAREQLTAIEAEWLRSRFDPNRIAGDEAYQRVIREQREQVEALERRLVSVERSRVLTGVLNDPIEHWHSASLEDRRLIVRTLLPTIRVMPANRRRWSAERLDIIPAA